MTTPVLWLDHLRLSDLAQVGGKNSSLGEMIGHLGQLGVSVPGGFATTADAYRDFLAHEGLAPARQITADDGGAGGVERRHDRPAEVAGSAGDEDELVGEDKRGSHERRGR